MNNIKTLIVTVLLLATIKVFSQNPSVASADSLKTVFRQQQDPKDKVKTSYQIARLLYRSNPEEALSWCDTTIYLGEKHRIADVLPKIYSIKGKAFDQQAKYEEALHFFSISADMAEAQRDTFQWASSLLSNVVAQPGLKKRFRVKIHVRICPIRQMAGIS